MSNKKTNQMVAAAAGILIVMAITVTMSVGNVGKTARRFSLKRKNALTTTASSSPDAFFSKRPDWNGHSFDFTSTIPEELLKRINGYADSIHINLDIDIVTAVVPDLRDKTLEQYAAELFNNWQIGKYTKGQKGVLILIAKKEQKIKIEVGYGLEHVYTDAYIGQVERGLLTDFLAQADWERGFLSTLENFFGHAEDMLYDKSLDVRKITSDIKSPHWSGGAGTSGIFKWADGIERAPIADSDLRKYFGAQASPGLAFERYLEKCAREVMDYTLDIYTDESKQFFTWWKTSPGQGKAESAHFSNKPYTVYVNGNYAVVLIEDRNDPDVLRRHNPHYFKKSEKGWQIDIAAMSRTIMMARAHNWYFMTYEHPYMFPFVDGYYIHWPCGFYPYDGQKAYLGFTYERFDESKNRWYVKPEFESAALHAGISPQGGLLLSIDGVPITKKYQDWEMMKNYNPGEIINVEISQGGRQKIVPVKLRKIKLLRENYPYNRKAGDPWLGIWYGQALKEERGKYHHWWYVIEVIPGSPMDKAGVKAGDYFAFMDLNAAITGYPVTYKGQKAYPGMKWTISVVHDGTQKDVTVIVGQWQPGKEGF